MIKYIGIVPDSPFLISSQKKTKYTGIFKNIAAQLADLSIDCVLSISDNAKFNRSWFSCYIDKKYQLEFSDFGDLITNDDIYVDWNLYNQIRESRLFPPIEPISDSRLDYGHAIPLYLIKSLSTNPFTALAINANSQIDFQQSYDFGLQLYRIAQNCDLKIALLFSGMAYQTHSPQKKLLVHQQNKDLIKSIAESAFELLLPNIKETDPELLSPSLAGIMPILKGVNASYKGHYQEILAETTEFSTLFACQFL